MNALENQSKELSATEKDRRQNGSALVIAIFVLALISVFVALALSRTTAEAIAIGNETTEGRTFYAAQGSLEVMTRNFNKVFEKKLNPSQDDINSIESRLEPGLTPQFTFNREVDRTSTSVPVVVSGGPYAGLIAIRDSWRLRTTATDPSEIQIQLTRNILNNRIPIFQFGIFYDDDLELYRPPRFSFGGRVHSNRHFFVSPGDEGVYFDSRVTAAGHIITQSWRNGNTSDMNKSNTFIKNASGVDKQLLPTQGSVLNTTAGAADNEFSTFPDLPPSKLNPDWTTQSAVFDGNLRSKVDPLKLPLKVDDANADLVELIKRGKKVADSNGGDLWKNTSNTLVPVAAADADNDIQKAERFANKTGIRISLADTQAKLPGCASGLLTAPITTVCGIRLDGNNEGKILPTIGSEPYTSGAAALQARGYQPLSMKLKTGGSDLYTATRVNGERLYFDQTYADGQKRGVWIKIETVQTNDTTGAIITKDITEDILSLGVTEQIPDIGLSVDDYKTKHPDNVADSDSRNINKTAAQKASEENDSRAIVKIQRFAIPGVPIPGEAYSGTFAAPPLGTTKYLYPYPNLNTLNYNFAIRYIGPSSNVSAGCTSGCFSVNDTPNSNREFPTHARQVDYGLGNVAAIVPFPIEMFDTREGTFYDNGGIYRANYATRNGVMSMIDIDVANLRRFLRGDYNGLFPTTTAFAASNSNVGLVSSNIPQKEGWVVYVSDRRGDADFDGEYDMEDIYGYGYNSATSRYYGSNGVLDTGEDFNRNGLLDTDFGNEAANKYDDDDYANKLAVTDHRFYRRGVRLMNATVIPGIYDETTSSNTRGFTLASENGVYVYGNYNATGVTSVPSTGNTPYDNYRPYGAPATATTAAIVAPTHIPASIVADSVTILSNSKFFASGSTLSNYTDGWNDAKSFANPYEVEKRLATETTIRFAMISGDTIASKSADPNQGGLSPKLNGGVHNFKRFLERWTDPSTGATFKTNLNYAGSLINLFISHNNNGSFKCCDTVYNPPVRNWVFDSTFLDPGRLPPGTPFFQYVQTTGFQRTND